MKKHAIALICLSFSLYSQLHSQLIINEIYADVAVSLIGDANGDGIRSAREDEFIELFNNGDTTLDISGYKIIVGDLIKHEFSTETLLSPKSFIVVFGGGTPNGLFGDSPIRLASGGSLGLSNSGATIILQDTNEITLDSLTYAATNIDASLVRTPEFEGDFLPHTERPDAFGLPYSPGTLTNSFPYNNGDTTLIHFTINRGIAIERDGFIDLFLNLINPRPAQVVATVELTGGTGTADDLDNFTSQVVNFPVNSNSQRLLRIPITDDDDVEGKESFIFTITTVNNPDSNQISINKNFELTIFDDDTNSGLLLTEFLADPPTGIIGDANGDGERNASQDEFVEFLNITDSTIDLSGMAIYDSDVLRHKIRDSTFLQPNQLLVVFGGGTITESSDEVIVQKASTNRLSLDNGGDRIILRDRLNEIIFFHEYGEEASNDQSIVICPIAPSGAYVDLTAIRATEPFSPGALHVCDVLDNTQEIYETAVKVYPNPTNNDLNIELSEELQLARGIELINIQGQTVLSTQHPKLSVQGLPNGFYLLKINTNRGTIVKKVITE